MTQTCFENAAICTAMIAALSLVPAVHADECEQLDSLELPHTEITISERIEAGTFAAAGANPSTRDAFARLPPFCRVAGTRRPTSDSDIRFEVWMPESNWNGKFVAVGNGAWGGAIPYSAMIAPLAKGFATAATDVGHQGSAVDASFAVGHPEKLIDFGHRGIHEMTVAAKSVIRAFYGSKPTRSLFVGCSTGGRQALMEASRHPEDYDGVSSMAPANPVVGLMISSLWTSSATLKDAASRISPRQFELVHAGAVRACDAMDGIADNIISAPNHCKFDPSALLCGAPTAAPGACLTEPQVKAMRAIYRGPHNPRTGESIYPGFAPGSEKLLPVQTQGDQPFPAVLSYFKDLLFQDPTWDFRTFDYDKDVAHAMRMHATIVDVEAAGLDAFLAQGRKLLLSHGWADPLVPPTTSIQFYQDLTTTTASATQNARLFMIPGMGHCEGGDGPFIFDALAIIDEWAETGRAPERIIATNPSASPKRTRPLCPFPLEAVYSARGSTDDEENFRCTLR